MAIRRNWERTSVQLVCKNEVLRLVKGFRVFFPEIKLEKQFYSLKIEDYLGDKNTLKINFFRVIA